MESVHQIIGFRTVVIVRDRVKGHWYYHARVGTRREGGAGEPIKGSGSFSRQSTIHRGMEFAKRDLIRHRKG